MVNNFWSREGRHFFLSQSYLIAYATVFALWLVALILVPFIAPSIEDWLIAICIILPFNFFLFLYFLYLLHKHLRRRVKRKKFFFNAVGVSLFLIFPVVVVSFLVTFEEEAPLYIGLAHFILAILLTLPLSLFVFNLRLDRERELFMLKQELENKKASLNFLNWQVNPHFLYNALNTLYASAIKDGSETTGEGILKLAGMMRYVLEGNKREKVLIKEEVDYLTNYIDLQKIKVDSNKQASVKVDFHLENEQKEIYPMLLLPFIENAFKHGLSFKYFSPIEIKLDVTKENLELYVYNKKHSEQKKDLIGYEGGIGLENVKQRLQILYPGNHKISVRDEPSEYEVNLNLTF